jgi:hypothetical protein
MLTIPASSTEYVRVPTYADDGGVPIDPITAAYTVQMAFEAGPLPPASEDWVAAGWDTTAMSGYVAQCLIGPSGVTTLTADTYNVWVQIAAGPETVVRTVGQVAIT